MSLAVGGTTCVAFGLLNVDVFPQSSVCASLLRFFFVENRAEVHAAGGSQVQPRESGPVHKKQLLAVVWAPPRKKTQPGATRPQWEHVALGRWVSSLGACDSESTSPTTTTWNRRWCSLRPRWMLPRTSLGVFIPTSRPAWNVFSHEAGSWQAPCLPGGRHSGDGHRRGHRSAQTAHPYGGTRLAQQARYDPARIGRARSVQPEAVGLHARRGGQHPLGP